uniref:Uncharacterized protein n=1 Tax=Xiphophorus couchianus TaxID=32473 RepID=A0A3B5M9B0_9TELE
RQYILVTDELNEILEKNFHSSARKLRTGNPRPSQPVIGCSRTQWCFWSGRLSLLTSVPYSQSEENSNAHFMQDSPVDYRNWRLSAKKNK